MAVPDHPAKNEYFHDFGDDLVGKTQAPLEEMPTSTFTSSNVHSAIYDFGERELFIRYLRDVGQDAIYQYTNVPAREWQGLKSAASKGSYVNANIAFEYNYAKTGRDELRALAREQAEQRVRRFVTTP
jgi:hypothetical protein